MLSREQQAAALSSAPEESGVYLLCAEGKLGNATHSASHYLGFSKNAKKRMGQHLTGDKKKGAAMTAAFVQRGIPFKVVRFWPGATYADELRLKALKKARLLCPLCSAR